MSPSARERQMLEAALSRIADGKGVYDGQSLVWAENYKYDENGIEIGMAANKDLRIVTYLQSELKLPEFLDYWPRLKKYEDIQKYINAHKYRIQEESLRNSISMDSYNFSNNRFTNDDFYRILKESLNN